MAGMQSVIDYYSPKLLTPFVSWMMDRSESKNLSGCPVQGIFRQLFASATQYFPVYWDSYSNVVVVVALVDHSCLYIGIFP